MADCGPGKLFGSTVTPTPTETLTPTDTPTFTPTLTETPSETPTATATKEPEIGGTTAVVYWRDIQRTVVFPPEFTPYLVPTSPDQWASLDTLTMSDGTPIPWGGAITYLHISDNPRGNWPVIPGLVRDVVEYGSYHGLPTYGAIIEFPVQGGSVFYIIELLATDKDPYLSTSEMIPGSYPVECAGGAVCTLPQILPAIKSSLLIGDPGMVSLLRKLKGKMVLFLMTPYPEEKSVIDAIARGSFPTGVPPDILPTMPDILYQP